MRARACSVPRLVCADPLNIINEETAPETWTMARPLDAHCEGINDIAWSMDASYCCTASDDKTVRLWDVARGQPISSFDGHESYVFCCCLNPSNTLLATGSFDETVKVWDVRVQKAVKTINAHSEPVTAVAFNGSVPPASDRRRRDDAYSGPKESVRTDLARETRKKTRGAKGTTPKASRRIPRSTRRRTGRTVS